MHVRLVPLAREHAEDLFEAGREAAIWRWMPNSPPRSVDDMRAWIDEALRELALNAQVPFAILRRPEDSAGGRASERAVGSTRFLDIRRAHRGLEIGWTWIALEQQRSAVNTECKRLLLAHAFEDLGAVRVQLKTDARNLPSQRAIERIGAVREGVLRRHMVVTDGFVRDSVLYSITDLEWPGVRARLDEFLRRA
jgi:RimJ/RimL family protein N-acetyltransferase